MLKEGSIRSQNKVEEGILDERISPIAIFCEGVSHLSA
jgi:hypothetical protein